MQTNKQSAAWRSFVNGIPFAVGYTSMWSLCVFECMHMCVCREEYRGSKIGRLFWPVISQLRDGLVTLAGSEAMTEWPSRPHTGTCADLLWQDYKTAAFTGWVYSDLTCVFCSEQRHQVRISRAGKGKKKIKTYGFNHLSQCQSTY